MQGHVLVTSAAAKILLIESFRAALAGRGRVYAGDLSPDAPARFAADGFVALKRSDAPDFASDLMAQCKALGVGFVVPTRDGELEAMAAARERFREAGIVLHVAASETIGICRDKRRFAAFCAARGLPVLPQLTLDEARAALPVFVRPARGAGGRGARLIETQADLEALAGDYESFIVNRRVAPYDRTTGAGAKEYTVDLLRDLDGAETIGAVVRERTRVVDGESQDSVVVDAPAIEAAARAAGEALGLVGHNTVQLFDDPDAGPLLIEVNPRFGGAANLGIRAGLDSPRRLLAMLSEDPRVRATALAPARIAIGLRMIRYKSDLFLDAQGRRVAPDGAS